MHILLVSGQALVRACLQTYLMHQYGAKIREVGSPEEAAQCLVQAEYSLIVLHKCALSAAIGHNCTAFRRSIGNVPVLAFCAAFEVEAIRTGFRFTVLGVLPIAATTEELLAATEAVLDGRCYRSVQFAVENQESNAAGIAAVAGEHNPAVLSGRESQVFRLLALGLPSTQIAEKLRLSAHTVQTYRARVLRKMKFRNNAELMRYAFTSGFMRIVV